ncbi:MAG: L,D-transpeptidase family protein [Anaerolineae bacterium]|nr:L,D-transpeptidase family protein [Anaerolineae bacterium]MDW8099021.1 L,D-transpeptidase family protein [Anaerolineae bacterium]
MHTLLRLLAMNGSETGEVHFAVEFPAFQEEGPSLTAPAILELGDGQNLELGLLSAPTAVTWREQHHLELASHRYAGSGPYTARLRWGEHIATAVIKPSGASEIGARMEPLPGPELRFFHARLLAQSPLEATVRLHITGLLPQHRLRVDCDAGQVRWLSGASGAEQTVEWQVSYPKPGTYTLAADLVDAEGFWLATLVESPLEIAEPTEPRSVAQGDEPADATRLATVVYAAMEALAEAQAISLPPWIPFRYVRPLWAWARTYTTPGGGRISRNLRPGTYLAIKEETLVDGALWYQSSAGDWIAASAVDVLRPSELRGVRLGTTEPLPDPPRPTPEPTPLGVRRGVITATVLNVRARPGVRPDNPPIDQLRQGTEVLIYEEAPYEGETWYRIGVDRWVHGYWVRVTDSAFTRAAEMLSLGDAGEVNLPVGWVVAPSLHVRARPGVSSDNPPIDQVLHNQPLRILETRRVGDANWYRIGEGRWVHGGWVGVAWPRSRPAGIRPHERWVGVSLREQTAVAYEGDVPVFAALVATGLPGTPTVQGLFRTWWRVRWRKMSGGRPGSYYYLEEVPWTCYFYRGYALHGAYWHDAFGRPRSHGCVNFSLYDSWWIFQWSEVGDPRCPTVYVYW